MSFRLELSKIGSPIRASRDRFGEINRLSRRQRVVPATARQEFRPR